MYFEKQERLNGRHSLPTECQDMKRQKENRKEYNQQKNPVKCDFCSEVLCFPETQYFSLL